MVTFQEFSNRLARGKLKNTSSVDKNVPGTIKADKLDEILGYVNQGLVDLSTRQTLITKLIDLEFVSGQNLYPLSVGATYLNATETDPFTGDLVLVMEIIDSDGCKHLVDHDGHIMTPTYNTLRFSTSKIESLGAKIRIRYQATHDAIDVNGDIAIPLNLETALESFVTYLYLSSMGGEEHIARGEREYGMYLSLLGIDQDRNLSSTSEILLDTRLSDRGFV